MGSNHANVTHGYWHLLLARVIHQTIEEDHIHALPMDDIVLHDKWSVPSPSVPHTYLWPVSHNLSTKACTDMRYEDAVTISVGRRVWVV